MDTGRHQEPEGPRIVSTSTAAEIAQVPEGTIRSWASRGKLTAAGTVNGVRYYWAAEVMRIESATRRRPRLRRLASVALKDLQR